MASSKTLNFLPEIFRTDANKKFLSATVDQLISEPNFKRINGYIGRRVAPTFKPSDNYILEDDKARQNYQLEPCVVSQNSFTDKIEFFSSYRDLLQKISYYGGNVSDHNRLFENEYYTFDGCFDLDKFINFNNYYWVPEGPEAVDIFAGEVDSEGEYTVTRNIASNGLTFSGRGQEVNPTLTLARGGTYVFRLDQPGRKFWIQTEPGVNGVKSAQANISTREVVGVINNGNDQGTVTFRVPLSTAQERFTSMTLAAVSDFAVETKYVDIHNHGLREFIKTNPKGFDGYRDPIDIDGKYLIFINQDDSDVSWTNDEIFDYHPYDIVVTETVPPAIRRNLWRIQLVPSDNDYIINLVPATGILPNQKVFIRKGIDNATQEFFIDYDGFYKRVPIITANLDRLYYQDESDPSFVGEIRLVDAGNVFINVETDIVGKINYTSPNGVIFTNGLKVRFNSQVNPEKYRQREYYIEGVGKAIQLIDVSLLVNPGYFDEQLKNLDYITINRGSTDLNAWTRSNRWFHIDVLKSAAAYNKTVDLPDNQYRAKRPIIEFEPNLQLYNFGREGLGKVDYLDFYIDDAFSQVEGFGKPYDSLEHYAKDDVVLVANQVYRAKIDLQQPPDNTSNWQDYGFVYDFELTRVYTIGQLTKYQNAIYRAIGTTAENLPTNISYWTPVAYDRNSAVVFNTDTSYQIGDLVSFENKYYICTSAAQGISPAESELTWSLSDTYVDYDVAIANTILKGQYSIYQGRLYLALMNIVQPPIGNAYWEEILEIQDGKTVIFAGDQDTQIRNSIYVMTMEEIGGVEVPHLTPILESGIKQYHTVAISSGENRGKNFWYDGTSWHQGKIKTSVNQTPLFEVIDHDGISFGDTERYYNSNFVGTPIFSYKQGTGKNDTILGYPLSYRNFGNVGDIEFSNDFNNSVVTYLEGTKELTKKIDLGYLISYSDRENISLKNVWKKASEKSHQYQIISHVFDGTTNYFEIDIDPAAGEKQIPYIKVFVDNRLLKRSQFKLETIGAKKVVRIVSSALPKDSNIDILIYSETPSEIGYYEIPPNLDFNPLNQDFEYLTLGQIKNHFFKLSENTKVANETVGNYAGYRDVQYKQNGGLILQQSSPMIYSNLFLQDSVVNFVDSIDFASKEYTKFKNKFLEIAETLALTDISRVPSAVDEILKNINFSKNQSSPWYYSDMVPCGDNRREYVDTVINPLLRQFDLPTVFNDRVLSNRAVLVYVNDQQLVKDRDYYFPQDRTAVIINDSYNLNAGDIVKIVDYFNTDGCYIPETPSKLGLYPKFVPYKHRDDSYRQPIDVIQGHDGSITPAFGDLRDELLIELEKRIYNNIKVGYSENIINIHDFIPGKFRDVKYSLQEFERVLAKSFLRWAGGNRVDFSTNSTFLANDPWTWNYWKYRDSIDGEALPGTWRAIYKYFYDTVRPNTHPWEMLGFSEEPEWWQDRYGPAPYTGGNLLLWTDLSEGYIHAGPRAGYDARFARPELLKIIPVDDYGTLRSPNAFAVSNFNSKDASRSFVVGNQGPAEYAWRQSSDYAFAVQKAIALTRPAFYFGSLMNVMRYNRNIKLDQLVLTDSLKRISPTDIIINGKINDDGSVSRVSGYLNWIRDYIINLGRDPIDFIETRLKNISVQLAYQVAGYTDKNYIKVLAEQSSPTSINDSVVVPEENFYIHLSKSSPIKKLVYSAVIVEKTPNGYTVSGYDLASPYFTIIPGLANNNAYAIEVGEQRGIIYKDYQSKKITVPYGYEFTSRQQVVDFLVSYGRFLTGQGFRFVDNDNVLNARKDWILSAREFLHWSQQGWSTGNLIILSPVGSSLRVNSPTGVVDHVKNTINGSKLLDQQFSTIKSNQFSVLRGNGEFKVSTLNESMISLAELEVVQYEHAIIFDNTTVFNDIIYKPELGNRQYRLKLVGSKTGNWAGELNPPGFIYNSEYVDDWQAGRDYKKGSVIKFKEQYYTALVDIIATDEFVQSQWSQIDRSSIKTGLLPNFAFNAQKFENIYDIDNSPTDMDLLEYSAGLIGFRERSYLTDFGLDPLSQVKFYQGFIKDKGTHNSIETLASAKLNNISSEINYFEEWALRIGEYGSIESDAQIEIILDETEITNDPAVIEFLDINDTPSPAVVGIHVNDVYRKTSSYKKDIFIDRSDDTDLSNDILTAGYVHVNDVDATVFDIRDQVDFDQYLSYAGRGTKIWVAKDFDNDWNVYRVNETDNNISGARYDLDENIMFFFEKPHNLSAGEVFIVKGLDKAVDGFYKVNEIVDIFKISSTIYKNSEDIKKIRNFNGHGVFLKTKSMRVDEPTDIGRISPPYGWVAGDRVWVERNDQQERWAVYEKSQVWDYSKAIEAQSSEFLGEDQFGYAVKMNSQQDLIAVSSPFTESGNVKTFVKLISGEFKQSSTLKPTQTSDVAGFGKSLDLADYTAVVGAPDSKSGKGLVYIYNFRREENLRSPQVLVNVDSNPGDNFGHSVCISENTNWIYVSSPGAAKVFAYYKDIGIIARNQSVDLVEGVSRYDIPFVDELALGSEDFEMMQLSIGSTVLTPGIDYTVDQENYQVVVNVESFQGEEINFSVAPGYRYAFTISNEMADSKFGHVVKTNYDGSRIFVSAPNHDLTKYQRDENGDLVLDDQGNPIPDEFRRDDNKNLLLDSQGNPIPIYRRESGAMYIYQRRVESRLIKSNQILYEPSSQASDIVALRLGETLINPRTGYTINSRYQVIAISDESVVGSFQYTYGDDLEEKFAEFLTDNDISLLDIADYSYTPISNSIELSRGNESGQILRIDTKAFDLAQFITSPDQIDYNHFGHSFDIDIRSKYLYVGAPDYRDSSYSRGKVYKFIDQGQALGQLKISPAIDLSEVESIFVNQTSVSLTTQDASLETLANDINLANIPGVMAEIVGSDLIIKDISSKKSGIEVYENSGNEIPSLSVETFFLDQEILEPDENVGSFGTNIRLDRSGENLLISSTDADLQQNVDFDLSRKDFQTRFDNGTTRFINVVKGSGAAYLYQLMSNPSTGVSNAGYMIFAEKLSLKDAYTGDGFGHGTDINRDFMLVSSPKFDPVPARSEYDIKVDNLRELSFIDTSILPNGTRILVLSDLNEQGRWSMWRVSTGSLTKIFSSLLSNIGSLHLYVNPTRRKPWDISRIQQPRVDLSSINRLMIYNRNTNTIIANLDFIDPVKGKILGAAEQDIDFKTEIDPAIYTDAIDGLSVDSNLRWGEQQVGLIWWNLSKVRFLDYEQSDLQYRSANWGSMFPGSEIEVCEWVSSSVPPSQYVSRGGTGVPMYDGQAYVVDTVVDSQSGIVNPRYYFWVSGKEETFTGKKKSSAASIANIISQPTIQGIAYAGILKSNAIALFGVNPYLSGQNIVLKIDYANLPNENTVHSEFELVQENRGDSQIPGKILDKLVDSLAGVDRVGNIVPDPRLSDSERVGISYRPRQNMFVDRARALKSVLEYVNRTFKTLPMARQFNIDIFRSQDPVPTPSGYDRKVNSVEDLDYIDRKEISVGYRVLIEEDASNDGLWTVWTYNGTKFNLSRIQVYKSDLYWEFVDWQDEGFDLRSEVDFTVDYAKDIATLITSPGDLIRVRYDQEDKFGIYQVGDDGRLILKGLEKGTIRLLPDLYDLDIGGMGFDAANFDNVRYDKTPGIEIREIVGAIRNTIFVGEFKEYFNKMFFVAVNYLLSEQKHNDWIFKTSFINIVHRLRKLDQYPSFVRDNQDYYIDYINEVKPYRTQIREYLLNYNGDEIFYGNLTDFDLSPYYDRSTNQYRSPNGERPNDAVVQDRHEYRDWKENHTFIIDRIEIQNPGSGYTVVPVITVEGGGGSGAVLRARTNYDEIVSIEVINPGKGYTSTPRILINGNGTGAKAYAVLRNFSGNQSTGYNLVRSLDTHIKFDRTTYEISIPEWKPNVTPGIYSDIISYNSQVYRYNIKNIFAVPIMMSAIETATVELINSFEVTETTLTEDTAVFIVGTDGGRTRISLNVDYSIDVDTNVLTVFRPELERVISVRYIGDQGNDEYQNFEIIKKTSYQFEKYPTDFSNNGSGQYKVLVGDVIKTPDTDYTIDGKILTVNADIIEEGQQIKIYVESDTISTVDPELIENSYYDEEANKWAVDVNGQRIHLDGLSSINVGQRVRGSGVNNFNNVVTVAEIREDSNEIVLTSQDKNKMEFKEVIRENDSLSFSRGLLSDPKTQIYFDKDKNVADPRRYRIDEESNSLTLVNPSLLDDDLKELSLPSWIKVVFTYNDPAILVSGKSAIEILYFISPIETEENFDYRLFSVVPGDQIDNAIDRIGSYYVASEGSAGQDPSQIVKGLRYPGVNVQGLPYAEDEETQAAADLIDTHISSRYQDTELGTRPEDITIDGGKYVDKFSSHAPEELVPGIIFDSVNMQVFTRPIRPWAEPPIDETPFTIVDRQQTDYRLTKYTVNETIGTLVYDGKVLVNGRDYEIISDGEAIRFLIREGDKNVDSFFDQPPEPGSTFRVYGYEVIGDHYGHRLFHGMAEDRNYYRISAEASTRLAQDLDLFDTEIHVGDASRLSSATLSDPGKIVINGEMITYLRNYARESKIDWSSEDKPLVVLKDAIVLYQDKYYLVQEDINSSGDIIEYISAGIVKEIDINTLARIRRGTNGTGAPLKHRISTRVVDVSDAQLLPGNADGNDWMNSAAEFGYKEVGDFDMFGYDASDAEGTVPPETTAEEVLARPLASRTGAKFDSLQPVNSAEVIPSEQARFLSKSPSFSP
jgi:hypothetical protein